MILFRKISMEKKRIEERRKKILAVLADVALLKTEIQAEMNLEKSLDDVLKREKIWGVNWDD